MRLFLFPTILLMIFLQACNNQPQADQKFIFKPDSSKIYSITFSRQSGEVLHIDNADTINNAEESAINLQLIRSVDSTYELKLTFENFTIKELPVTKTRRGNKTYFSKDTSVLAEKNPFQIQKEHWLALTKGQSVYVWMDNKGTVQRINGVDKIADSVSVLSKNDKKEIRYILKDYIGENIITDNLNQLFSIAPAHVEKIGDSWVRNIILINKAPVTLSNMYTINKVNGDSVYLDLNSSISARAAENAAPFMEGRGTGEIIISYSTGIPYSYFVKNETNTTTNANNYFTTETFSVVIK
jgi:uncharacterized protein DUF6263